MGAGFQTDHGETIELVSVCDEKICHRKHCRESFEDGRIQGKRKR